MGKRSKIIKAVKANPVEFTYSPHCYHRKYATGAMMTRAGKWIPYQGGIVVESQPYRCLVRKTLIELGYNEVA